jgi:hypothetical protein
MSWNLIDRPKTLKATKALSNEWASMSSIPHDRPLSERRIEIYRVALKEGAFRPVTWAKAVCDEDDMIYRVNGKHTSTLFANFDGDLPFVTIESYQCDTLEDLPRLYATFDSRTQSRTSGDINRTFAASNATLSRIPAFTINAIVSGLGYGMWQDQSYSRQPVERAELMLENVDFALWFYSIAGTVKPAILFRSPVVGAMFNTWSKNKTQATTFWRSVQDGTGEVDSPERKLERWLLVNNMIRGKGEGNPNSRKASPREFYVKCLLAWNAWRKQENTTLRYVATAALPKVI